MGPFEEAQNGSADWTLGCPTARSPSRKIDVPDGVFHPGPVQGGARGKHGASAANSRDAVLASLHASWLILPSDLARFGAVTSHSWLGGAVAGLAIGPSSLGPGRPRPFGTLSEVEAASCA